MEEANRHTASRPGWLGAGFTSLPHGLHPNLRPRTFPTACTNHPGIYTPSLSTSPSAVPNRRAQKQLFGSMAGPRTPSRGDLSEVWSLPTGHTFDSSPCPRRKIILGGFVPGHLCPEQNTGPAAARGAFPPDEAKPARWVFVASHPPLGREGG